MFKFPRTVSVDNGRTLSIPIIDRQVPAQRLALYQAETAARNPLAAIRLTNDGDSGLPPGIITIYERDKAGYVAYVGDARLSGFPVGETRLLAYALDEKITIERDAAQTDRIATGTIVAGCAAPLAHHPPDRDLSRARPGQGAAPARSSCSAACRAGPWSSPRRKSVELSEGNYRIPFQLAGRRPDPDLRGRAGADPAAGAAPGRRRGRPDPDLRPGARVRRQDARGAHQGAAAAGRRQPTPSAR